LALAATAAAVGLKPTPATEEQRRSFAGDGEIRGRLLWADGSPAAEERFDLVAYDGRVEHIKISEIVTDAEGHYRAAGLRAAPGYRYRLWLTSDANQRTYYIPLPRPGASVSYDYQFQPRLGELAPEHIMPDLGGRPVDLETFRGKVVILKFWAVWCGPCHAEMIRLGQTLRERPDWKDHVVVVAVNADPARATVTRFIEEHRLEGMVHLFEEGKRWESVRDRAFRINSVPFTFVLDRQGIVRFRNDDPTGVETLVDKLISSPEA